MVNKNFTKDWSEYYQITRNHPPSKLLIKAIRHVKNKSYAIDIGCGALKDTRYLLGKGFDVTAVDQSELMAKEAKKINSDKLHYFITPFSDFEFPMKKYDVASAMYSLPFNPPESFDAVFTNIKNSLRDGGVFCGQLFGVHDDWSTRDNMTFHTKEQARGLLRDMNVIYFQEEENDGTMANGTQKHWHIFHFIAQSR